MSARRVTIMLDDDIEKKARALQSRLIKQENRSVSLSEILNGIMDGSYKI